MLVSTLQKAKTWLGEIPVEIIFQLWKHKVVCKKQKRNDTVPLDIWLSVTEFNGKRIITVLFEHRCFWVSQELHLDIWRMACISVLNNSKNQQLPVWAKEEFVMIKVPQLYLLFYKRTYSQDFVSSDLLLCLNSSADHILVSLEQPIR